MCIYIYIYTFGPAGSHSSSLRSQSVWHFGGAQTGLQTELPRAEHRNHTVTMEFICVLCIYIYIYIYVYVYIYI